MNTTTKWVLVLAGAVCGIAGLKMMKAPPPQEETLPPAVEPDAEPSGQVTMLDGPETEAPPATPTGSPLRADEAERRSGTLAEVLAPLENSAVYVEGVDDPRPDDPENPGAPQPLDLTAPKKKTR
jgi:hypothetical protein